jgi:hypothetical protein
MPTLCHFYVFSTKIASKCNFCGQDFSSAKDLKYHQDAEHREDNQLKCFECDQTFKWVWKNPFWHNKISGPWENLNTLWHVFLCIATLQNLRKPYLISTLVISTVPIMRPPSLSDSLSVLNLSVHVRDHSMHVSWFFGKIILSKSCS